MRKLTLLAILAALLAAPAFAGATDSASQVDVPVVAGIDIDAWIAAGTDRAMQEAVAQSGVQATSGCSATTVCQGGNRISCEGANICFVEGTCGIYCDTTGFLWCFPAFCP